MKIYDSADNVILEVVPDDSSYRYREIMGDNRVTLYYQLAEHVEIPVGAYIVFEGARYTLYSPGNLTKKHSRYFDYTVVFEAEEVKAKTWKVRNTVDRRLKFSLTAKPKEHLEMIVANLNARETGWSVGACVVDTEKCINYNHTYIYEALGMIATEFGTEFEFGGKTVSLHKVEYDRDAPLALSYGRGNGLKSGVGRTSGDRQPVEILYTEGGEKNIDASRYGARELHLPKGGEIGFDGVRFEDEDGYDSSRARVYVADADGYSIRRKGATLTSKAEDSLDCTDIYPKRVGKVSAVVTVDEARNFYDIVDNGIPEALDYSDCLIAGEKMTIIFQSGMLAGREFDCKYYHSEKGEKAARRFEIVPAEIDGVTMPGGSYMPAVNDTYAVFNVMLPDAYINDAETKTGAEWEMMRTAVRYLYDNEERKMTFSGSLDGIWSKKDWANIGGKIRLGGFVSLSDTQFQETPVLVRITGIKDYINRPYSPEVELSNETVTSGFTGTIGDLKGDEVTIEDNARQAREYAKRGFRDARETMQMLQEAMLDNFTGSISPIAVQTMQMIVGDESLQYRFIKNKANPVPDTDFAIVYDKEARQLTVTASILQHMTLGINDISGSHAADEYSYWDMEAFVSAALTDAAKSYYLYAKCSKTEGKGSFILSETPIRMEGVDGYYHFLAGILNRERDGERSFATVYGFTEILPGQMLTEKIRSSDGLTWWDLATGNFNMRNKLMLDGDTLTLNGALVQTGSGAMTVIGAYCGAYSSSRKYQLGDEVYATVGGVTSTYRYVNSVASAGHGVTDGNYWIPVARGAKGSPGTPGEDGKDGRGIASAVVEYAVSGDGRTAPVAGWSETIPAVSAGFYLWTRTTTTYTDNTVSVSYSVSRAGTDGKAGAACPYQGDYDSTKTYYGNDFRCDVVRYNNRYYRALPTVSGSFSGRIPTNTAYWTPFGASFDNIATGFLFAEEAWVENLGVSFLKTGSSGKRVLINEDGNNDITVYNGNEERVRITGDSIGALSSLFVQVVKGLSSSKSVMNDVADKHSKEIDYYSLLYGYSIPYEIKQGDTFSLRAVKGGLTALPYRVEQDPDGNTSVMYNGIEIVYTLYNGETAVKTLALVSLTGGASGDDVYVQGTNLYDYTRPVLQEGETTTLTDSGWSVKVTFHANIQSDYVINNLTSTSAQYGFDAYIIRAGKRKMLIGSDGFFYVIGPQQYVFVSNNDSISMRAGNAGLTLKDDELKLRLGGTEYKVSALNNTIRLTAV